MTCKNWQRSTHVPPCGVAATEPIYGQSRAQSMSETGGLEGRRPSKTLLWEDVGFVSQSERLYRKLLTVSTEERNGK